MVRSPLWRILPNLLDDLLFALNFFFSAEALFHLLRACRPSKFAQKSLAKATERVTKVPAEDQNRSQIVRIKQNMLAELRRVLVLSAAALRPKPGVDAVLSQAHVAGKARLSLGEDILDVKGKSRNCPAPLPPMANHPS